MKSPFTINRIASAVTVAVMLSATFALFRPDTVSLNATEVSHLTSTLEPGQQFTEAVFRQLRFEPLPSTRTESP